jgi:RNA-directed DNA polymerase
VDEAKPFDIPKQEVWEAFKKVKANQGAAGVDGQSVAEFEAELSDNLYKLWNRMSSGSYFPPPVRRVMIPKPGGTGERPFGIPTVADRVAQEVVKRYLEPILEPIFHEDSYGYRPGRSAIDAVRTARQRCWRYDWVLDIDVKGYFDSIDWSLLLKAVRSHTDCPWVLLYIERWLEAPVQLEDGSVVPRMAGTPQGGVISPTLANLFLHYAFDMWMKRTFPAIPFERYADDCICHCRSEEEARALWVALEARFVACGLVLHPQKTKLVYCKDTNRRGDFPIQSFTFLGYMFRPRKAIWRGGQYGVSFLPAASPDALKAIRQTVRRWELHHRSDMALDDLARYLGAPGGETPLGDSTASAVFVHHHELACQAAGQLSGHHRSNRSHHDQDRPEGDRRTRRQPVSQRHRRLGRTTGRHKHRPGRFSRRMELHYQAVQSLRPSG